VLEGLGGTEERKKKEQRELKGERVSSSFFLNAYSSLLSSQHFLDLDLFSLFFLL
jgi:hypothetical protein